MFLNEPGQILQGPADQYRSPRPAPYEVAVMIDLLEYRLVASVLANVEMSAVAVARQEGVGAVDIDAGDLRVLMAAAEVCQGEDVMASLLLGRRALTYE